MNIQSLQYILTIEQLGSINQATQRLYLSQSSLSRTLKELEAQVGFSIFQRTSRSVVPTHDGRMFLEQHFLSILEQLFYRGRYL